MTENDSTKKPKKKKELSPMMKQYVEIKKENEDSILFFRLGDFYEMFFEDAELASKELNLTLTSKLCGLEERAPMCGVPVSSYEVYAAKLVEKGYKVAICEQVDGTNSGNDNKGIRNRKVVRKITRGTITDGPFVKDNLNNYICSIYGKDNDEGICFCDVSTGELYVTNLVSDDNFFELEDEILKYRPSEIIAGGNKAGIEVLEKSLMKEIDCMVNYYVPAVFDDSLTPRDISDNFSREFVEAYKRIPNNLAKKSVMGLLTYLDNIRRRGAERVNTLQYYFKDRFMHISARTVKNLELVETLINKTEKGSLLSVLDETETSMGKRLLRKWIENPLVDIEDINERLDTIQALNEDVSAREDISQALYEIKDVQRLITKVVYRSANGKDLKLLASTVRRVIKLNREVSNWKLRKGIFSRFHDDLDDIEDLCEFIEQALQKDVPPTIKQGGFIIKGFDEDVDIVVSNQLWKEKQVQDLEEYYRRMTGLPKLKISYNGVLGYFIETTHAQAKKLPEMFRKKQTLINCERFDTKELKSIESKVSFAKEKANYLEFKVFSDICGVLAKKLSRFQYAANCVAIIDVLCAFSRLSQSNKYTRPIINKSGSIKIKDGRHPVIEAYLPEDVPFVSNDVLLDEDKNRIAIITGPNMSGKSTYMRQVALIVLMAQIGCYVPAKFAEIGIVDRIFTRVGASDDLSSGQSTFMVEMNEVANILKHATKDSLLILDEIGRGTSTFDGMSIARAVLEYIVQKDKLGAKSLFATHYHELTKFKIEGIKNYNIAVKKEGDDITFLRKIVPGGADESYGIEVAKLSGLPKWIIDRSKQILKDLEKNSNIKQAMRFDDNEACINNKIEQQKEDKKEDENLINILQFIDKLKSTGVESMTPLEAMNTLYKLSNEAKELDKKFNKS